MSFVMQLQCTLEVSCAIVLSCSMSTTYRPGGVQTICPPRRWHFYSRRIYGRVRSQHMAKLQAACSVPIPYSCAPRVAAPWDRQTDRQTDGSRYRLMPPHPWAGEHNNSLIKTVPAFLLDTLPELFHVLQRIPPDTTYRDSPPTCSHNSDSHHSDSLSFSNDLTISVNGRNSFCLIVPSIYGNCWIVAKR